MAFNWKIRSFSSTKQSSTNSQDARYAKKLKVTRDQHKNSHTNCERLRSSTVWHKWNSHSYLIRRSFIQDTTAVITTESKIKRSTRVKLAKLKTLINFNLLKVCRFENYKNHFLEGRLGRLIKPHRKVTWQ